MKTLTRFLGLLLLINTPAAMLAGQVVAQPYPPASPAGTNQAPYPHVDLAPGYRVDPSWPQRPPEIPCGQVPSIAVDSKGNLYLGDIIGSRIQKFVPVPRLRSVQ